VRRPEFGLLILVFKLRDRIPTFNLFHKVNRVKCMAKQG
jgi:hypothetical protein